jgi:SpoVK/Ycf46/Vps4 family AAA+-type ATPase
LRKGRLDEIFFVDLPSEAERLDILRIHLKKRSRDPGKFDVAALARTCEGFSGAEIEEAIVSALFDAFSRQEELSTELIHKSLTETVPLSKTMNEEMSRLRNWASGRARPASTIQVRVKTEDVRKIEF